MKVITREDAKAIVELDSQELSARIGVHKEFARDLLQQINKLIDKIDLQ